MKWKYCSYKILLNFFFFTYCRTPGRRLYTHHTKNILLFYLYFRQREWLGWVWQENLFVGSRHSMLTFIGQAWDFPSTLSSIMGVILFVHKCVNVCHYELGCVNVFACVFARVMILCMYVGWFVHHYDSNNWLDSSEWLLTELRSKIDLCVGKPEELKSSYINIFSWSFGNVFLNSKCSHNSLMKILHKSSIDNCVDLLMVLN